VFSGPDRARKATRRNCDAFAISLRATVFKRLSSGAISGALEERLTAPGDRS
jgi:hypothetical protein